MKAMDERQVAGIVISVRYGRILKEEIPEIAEDYRSGISSREIARNHDISGRYGMNGVIAFHAVQCAIRGHEGGFRNEPYEGLIPDKEELDILRQEQSTRNKEKYFLNSGAGRYTDAIRKKLSDAGKKAHRMGAGIHTQNTADNQRLGRLYGRLGAIAEDAVDLVPRRFYPDRCTFSEIEYAYMLYQNPRYRIQTGANKGKGNTGLIAEKLNEVFHKGEKRRKKTSIGIALRKYRRKLRKLE